MFHQRAAAIAALAAAGALALTACGSGSGPGDAGGDKATSSAAAPGPDARNAAAGEGGRSGVGDLTFLSGTAERNGARPGTGDWAAKAGGAAKPEARSWVQLTAGKAGALNPVVVNGAGLTLYRFDKDSANPSKSTCNGECATTWPPVLIAPGGKIFADGVKKSALGVIKRDDGTHQVTINGWPVYRFAKDARPGDTKGQGVGGTWFGVTPDGGKAGRGGGSGKPADGGSGKPGGGTKAPATSVVLFDDKDFADNGAQGLAGKGCQNVFRDNVASSLTTNGTLKIWSEADCKGRSKVVDGDVADLAAIGFGDTVSSVFFG
ncbi:COG4315 family predicted lipoprotein [Streptomyces griseocarneus]|uniref:COG4315 family predicted lipoprotein n=1 Tax=Streptomyces griseocarneus TaxID=51201 RepID=UPI00167EB8CB|nr:hypothetical protein [Streptomyces griseocarneus]MBZ6474779.1 hypothetical protein [Streptomyces griseocarneus]GHG48037.1 hypothetical protein GCM10018779_05960 [Streptomyces griseocarneus]